MAGGFVVVIPARLKSTRLPDKPLADIAGKTRGVPGDCDMLNVARAMGISLG